MPRKKGPPDKDQGKRFIETARKLGSDETGEAFDVAVKAILSPRQLPPNRARPPSRKKKSR